MSGYSVSVDPTLCIGSGLCVMRLPEVFDQDDNEDYYTEFALRMTEFMSAIQNRKILANCIEISHDVMSGAYYNALTACRKLFDFEEECLNYDPEGPSNCAALY